MNKKGFTLVELLAVIAIIGILSGVAIISVDVYLNKAKKQALDTIFDTAYDASVNYLMNNSSEINKLESGSGVLITVKKLVDEGYMEEPMNPNNRNESCLDSGSESDNRVLIYKKPSTSSSDGLDQYIYDIYIKCNGTSVYKKYPKE